MFYDNIKELIKLILKKSDKISSTKSIDSQYFLVYGQGNLGQHCVKKLKEFGMNVKTISIQENPKKGSNILQDSIKEEILKQGNLKQCRAVLLVTDNESLNINAAEVVNSLNKKVRLVIRSTGRDLNEIYKGKWENFISYDAAEIPAQAIAIKALANENQGIFQVEKNWFQVIELDTSHQKLFDKFHQKKRIISHVQGNNKSLSFHQWNPDKITGLGDKVIYIEINNKLTNLYDLNQQNTKPNQNWLLNKVIWWKKKRQQVLDIWHSAPNKFIIKNILIIWVVFLIIGITFFKLVDTKVKLFSIFYTTFVMLLGGYHEVFNSFDLTKQNSAWFWRRLINLIYMVIGIFSISIVNAWLTEWLLNEKFYKTFSYPQQNHIVVIGLGRVGQQVATILKQLHQQLIGVAIINLGVDKNAMPKIPIELVESGKYGKTFQKVNLASARSIVVVTDDEKYNMEIAYMASRINPNSLLIIRAFTPSLRDKIKKELSRSTTKVFCDYELSAETFVATAFSKNNNIIQVLRLNDHTILVAEYTIDSGHPLEEKTLTQVAYGWETVPIFYQKLSPYTTKILPKYWLKQWDKSPLKSGERLIVIATINSLQKIDQGAEPLLPEYEFKVKRGNSRNKKLSDYLKTFGILYYHQALMLKQKLKSDGYNTNLIYIEKVGLRNKK